MRVVKVAVNLPLWETYSYSVPEKFSHLNLIGYRVIVPFQNRKVEGYVVGYEESIGRELKQIEELLEDEPLITENLIQLLFKVSSYYLYPIGPLIRSILPGGAALKVKKSIALTPKGRRAIEKISDDSIIKDILNRLNQSQSVDLRRYREEIRYLRSKGWIQIEEYRERSPIRPSNERYVCLAEGIDIKNILRQRLKAKDERSFLELFLVTDEIRYEILKEKISNFRYLIEKWKKKGVLKIRKRGVLKSPKGLIIHRFERAKILDPIQKDAISQINTEADSGHGVFLLYGISGSEKTEVYLRCMEYVINKGKSALLLVPEVALAQSMWSVFRSVLGEKVTIYHSELSIRERYDQWLKIMRGDTYLVIGPRSALFTPLKKLGIIIVDEEHDFSYKQEEGTRIHVRDCALLRGEIEDVPVILGSSMPSVDSFYKCEIGKFKLIEIQKRPDPYLTPQIELIDMKGEGKNKKRSIISKRLLEALEDTINKKMQAIVFLNRRGFNRIHICSECGRIIRCKDCDMPMIFHLKDNRLICHHCGFSQEMEMACSFCKIGKIRAYGFGTERLERELKRLFPQKNIIRFDRDSVKTKTEEEEILKELSEGNIDILIGTQMITKAYEFSNVALIGVISADLSLVFPDFRAPERTFQLLSQLISLAQKDGVRRRVIVQSFNPSHYAILNAINSDYLSFYKREIDLRRRLFYPPFSHLINIVLSSKDRQKVEEVAESITKRLKFLFSKEEQIKIMGPSPAPLSKLRGRYRWQILCKFPIKELMEANLIHIHMISKEMSIKDRDIRIIIDVDPYNML